MQIKGGTFTAGTFTSFIIALLMLLEPLKRLVGIHNIFQQALGASHKVFEYLDHQEDDGRYARRAASLRVSERASSSRTSRFHYPGAPDGFRIPGL